MKATEKTEHIHGDYHGDYGEHVRYIFIVQKHSNALGKYDVVKLGRHG